MIEKYKKGRMYSDRRQESWGLKWAQGKDEVSVRD